MKPPALPPFPPWQRQAKGDDNGKVDAGIEQRLIESGFNPELIDIASKMAERWVREMAK